MSQPDESSARRCDGCGRMVVSVKQVGLLVDGGLVAQRALCPGCRVQAEDEFARVVAPWLAPA